MEFFLSSVRLLWRPIYRFTRPLARVIVKFRVSQISADDLISEQKILFRESELDWIGANRIVIEIAGPHTDLKSHRSQHYELVAAIGQAIKAKRILEIGTADASFTSFVARAFPDSLVETIDLPVNDQRFWNATDDESSINKAVSSDSVSESPELRVRNENLRSSPNIVFREMNSLELSRFEDHKYDLIWVDGDHTFPVVACDFANAVRLLEIGGVMMCDDIYLTGGRKGKWGSQETLKVLDAFEKAKMTKTSFVLKSIRPERNFSTRVKKHLAVVKLNC